MQSTVLRLNHRTIIRITRPGEYYQTITGREQTNKNRGAPVAERQSALPPKRQWRSANMTLQGLNDAKHRRDRAAEMRVLSGEMKDHET
jgi:hypothetical protein